MYFIVFFCYLILNSNPSFGIEPACSPFHYEEQTLKKMIRQEIFVERMKTDIDESKQQVADAIVDLKNEKDKFATDFDNLKREVETMNNNMKTALSRLQSQTEHIVQSYTMEMEKIKGSVGTPIVAFKAHIVSDKTVSENNIFVFSENIFNTGDAYDNTTGIFKAPIGGVYLFTTQICLPNSDHMYFGITLNGEHISQSLLGDSVWHKCYTMNAIAVVNIGDDVLVRCTASCGDSDRLWNNLGYATSSFSGVLVHRFIH